MREIVPTPRTRVVRLPKRASYERATIEAILDEGLICHAGFALEANVEHVIRGRWADIRWPTEQELKATTVLCLPIEEASAKIRTGPPIDDEEDYGLACWAGVIPLTTVPGTPISDPRLAPGAAPPASVRDYRRPVPR